MAAEMVGLIQAIPDLQYEQVHANATLKTMNPLIEESKESKNFPMNFLTNLKPLRTFSSITGKTIL